MKTRLSRARFLFSVSDSKVSCEVKDGVTLLLATGRETGVDEEAVSGIGEVTPGEVVEVSAEVAVPAESVSATSRFATAATVRTRKKNIEDNIRFFRMVIVPVRSG